MKAVVLAAGEGTRLRPLTLTRSKHMIPLAGKPILEHLLLALRDGGVTEVLVVVSHHEDFVRNYFGDGSRWDLEISYIHQEKLLGTADAIALAEEYVGDEDFLVVYGDLLIDPSAVKSAIKKHSEKDLITLSVVPVENPERYGVVTVEKDLIKEIVEKPKPGTVRGKLVNAGVYVFSGEVFKEIRRTSKSLRTEYEITDTIQLLLKRNVQVAANPISRESWMDIGQPWDLLEANQRVLERAKPVTKGTIEDGAHTMGVIILEEGARIRSGAYIEGPAYIGGGSDVGPNCFVRPFTSIGRNVRIGNACEIKNSLILDGTHIGHLSYVGDSIVGENCNFGAGTLTANLRFDNGTIKVMVKAEVRDSGLRKLGVIMGDHVETGIGARFMPGVKIEPHVWIGPSVTVYRDVPSGMLVLQKQELENREMRRRD